MGDAGVFGNLVWNAAHGHGLRSSVLADQPYFAFHFTLMPYLLAPLVRLWESVQILAIAQGLALGSSLLAAFLLTRRLTDDSLAPWCVAALAMSTLYFHDLVGATLDNSLYGLPFFLWGCCLYAYGRYWGAALLGGLLLATREQAPFAIAGWGAYMALSGSRGRLAGTILAAAAAAAWAGEMQAIRCFQGAWEHPWTRWELFEGLGGSPEAVFDAALRRPWAVALALVWPPLKLWTVAKAFLAMALLPPASGAAVITALIAWIPNQLADVDEGFHRLGLHYSAFVYGPLIFAAAQGAARWSELLGPSGRRRLHAWILVAAGTQLLMNSDFLIALMPSRWKGTVPRALSHIPKDAKLWADDFLLPHVGMRRHLKSLPRDFPYPLFEGGLFEPDRVLMSLHWAERADRRARDAVIGALRGSGYRVVFQEGDLLVWSRPESPPPASRRTRGPSARSRSRS